MARALAFLLKVGILVAIAVWIADRPGFVRIEWMDYTVNIQVGFFLLMALAALLMAIFIYRVIQTFVEFPRSFRRYLELRRKEKGYMALTRGLAAVAAGDAKAAQYQAHRAGKLLPEDDGLPFLLRAQAARLNGKEEEAREIFAALTLNKNAGFLGLRGLLQGALDAGDYEAALELGQRALRMYPKQGWILSLVYDLEIRARAWNDAKTTLYRAEKAGAIPSPKAASDRIAILLAQAQDALGLGFRSKALGYLQQAYRYHPYFPPAALALARFYKQDGHRRKASAIVYRTWRKNPHPDLARIWDELIPPGNKPMARVRWFEKLKDVNAASVESHIALARVAMEEGLWGEARGELEKAENAQGSAEVYRLWLELERRAPTNPMLQQTLQQKLAENPLEKRWVCRETGAIYEEWRPIAEPHGSFNTIEWDYPHGSVLALRNARETMAEALLEAPRVGGIS